MLPFVFLEGKIMKNVPISCWQMIERSVVVFGTEVQRKVSVNT